MSSVHIGLRDCNGVHQCDARSISRIAIYGGCYSHITRLWISSTRSETWFDLVVGRYTPMDKTNCQTCSRVGRNCYCLAKYLVIGFHHIWKLYPRTVKWRWEWLARTCKPQFDKGRNCRTPEQKTQVFASSEGNALVNIWLGVLLHTLNT